MPSRLVGICSDADVSGYKRPPIMSAQERAECALCCRWVDEVVVGCPFVLTADFVDSFQIKHVVHGDDHSAASARKYYGVALDRGIYKTVPYTQGISTSDLIARCASRGSAAADRVHPHGH